MSSVVPSLPRNVLRSSSFLCSNTEGLNVEGGGGKPIGGEREDVVRRHSPQHH